MQKPWYAGTPPYAGWFKVMTRDWQVEEGIYWDEDGWGIDGVMFWQEWKTEEDKGERDGY